VRKAARDNKDEVSFGLKYAKRAFDLVGAAAALTVLSPAFAVIAFLIKITSAGPVFFRQERTGKEGKPFFIFKFRTMVKDAPQLGPDLTGAGDPRITRVGNFLRVTKLDELPNLINVVRGEMSLVGPRPDLPRFMSALTPEHRRILRFRPGITGPTQLRYIAEEEFLSPVNIDDNYVDNILVDKLASDSAYVSNWSLGEDFLLILYTPVALLYKVFGRAAKLFPLYRARPPGKRVK
jgi:lipopolysaccharide/colanic/teichoic acid biosynthesis glycosyltransferase